MKITILLKIIYIIILIFFLKACAVNKEDNSKTIGMVLSVGGLGDKSFNDLAYKGLLKAKRDFGLKIIYGEPERVSDDIEYLRTYAEEKFSLIIAVGFLMKDALSKVAVEFPDQKFAIIDSFVTNKNTASLTFREDQGSFLVGSLAAMVSKTGIIGFVGGMNIPLIQKFEYGYKHGAMYINPKIVLLNAYIGSTTTAFSDPVKGKEIALSEISKGADVVFHAAGSSGNGVIEAAKNKKVFAIGVDADQDYMGCLNPEKPEPPSYVITSMLKRVDVAVYETIKSVVENRFTGGLKVFGIKENGVGTTDFKYSKKFISKNMIKRLEKIRLNIANGKIKI